jgi:hypothetical protein
MKVLAIILNDMEHILLDLDTQSTVLFYIHWGKGPVYLVEYMLNIK